MAEQALTALEMLSRRHSKAILQAVSKTKTRQACLCQLYILVIVCEDEIRKQLSVTSAVLRVKMFVCFVTGWVGRLFAVSGILQYKCTKECTSYCCQLLPEYNTWWVSLCGRLFATANTKVNPSGKKLLKNGTSWFWSESSLKMSPDTYFFAVYYLPLQGDNWVQVSVPSGCDIPMYIWNFCGSVTVTFYKTRQIRCFNSKHE